MLRLTKFQLNGGNREVQNETPLPASTYIDGLLFPSALRTMPGPDERIVGNHLIMNIDISKPFEYDKTAAPDGADFFDGELRTMRNSE